MMQGGNLNGLFAPVRKFNLICFKGSLLRFLRRRSDVARARQRERRVPTQTRLEGDHEAFNSIILPRRTACHGLVSPSRLLHSL